jgi:hypothetical protein
LKAAVRTGDGAPAATAALARESAVLAARCMDPRADRPRLDGGQCHEATLVRSAKAVYVPKLADCDKSDTVRRRTDQPPAGGE